MYLVQGNAQDKISEFYNEQDFESIRLNPVEGDQRIILVAANFRKEVTSTVMMILDWMTKIIGMKLLIGLGTI